MVQVKEYQPFKTESSINIDAWLERLKIELIDQDIEPIRLACVMAEAAVLNKDAVAYHCNDWGNCYFAGLEIAEILIDLKQDAETLVAGILYRAVREQKLSLTTVQQHFGNKVAWLIEGVQQMAAISAVNKANNKPALGDANRQIENVRKMLVSMIADVRVVLIKLAERTWAIRAVKNASESRKQKIASEVCDVYAPLAHRLGIGHIKWELEDVSFRYLSPKKYKMVAKLLDERRLDRERYLNDVINVIETKLRNNNIDAIITGRVKHIYSIYCKMKRKHISFDQVYDIRALRILVPNIRDCYATLGIVHEIWRHIPKEFDDYIATPKRNGYRSLHTAVFGPESKGMEIQIRTHEMHEDAEFGVCSHWSYKGADKNGRAKSYEEKIDWLRQILQWHEENSDLQLLTDELRIDVEPDQIYIFTPDGHVIDLVCGATPVDFAYRVHTEVGHNCHGCKVNGQVMPLNYKLQTGDQVEILTLKNGSPNRAWLNPALGYVSETRTKIKIQHWFKAQNKEKNIQAGRAMINVKIKRLALKEVDLGAIASRINYKNEDDMLSAVGAGELRISQILNVVHEQFELKSSYNQLKLQLSSNPLLQNKTYNLDVKNAFSNLADCCNPVPGDDCLGYLAVGQEISIHKIDCSKVIRLAQEKPECIINVQWDNSNAIVNYSTHILIQAFDRQGLLRDITNILTAESVNVSGVNSQTNYHNNIVELRLTVEVSDFIVLSKVLDQINQLPNIFEAKRYIQDN